MAKQGKKSNRKNYTTYTPSKIKAFKEYSKDILKRKLGSMGTSIEDYAVSTSAWIAAVQNKLQLAYSVSTEELREEMASLRTSYIADGIYWYRDNLNYFIPPDTADFCSSCINDFTKDYYSKLPGQYKELPKLWSTKKLEKSLDRLFVLPLNYKLSREDIEEYSRSLLIEMEYTQAIVLHFHKQQLPGSILVLVNGKGDPIGRLDEFLFTAVSRLGITTQPIDKEYRVKMLTTENMHVPKEGSATAYYLEQKGYTLEQSNFIIKFIYGFGVYAEEFPEMLVPTTDKHFTTMTTKPSLSNFKVLPNNLVRSEIKNRRQFGTDPHWRNGTYKLLSHPRFVHKQGQRVYVKGSFIKGRAQTALMDLAI